MSFHFELPLAQVAELLGVSKQAMDYHRRVGHISVRKAGRIYLVDPEKARQEIAEHASKNYRRKIAPPEEISSEQQEESTPPKTSEE